MRRRVAPRAAATGLLNTHAMLAQVLGNVFQELRLAASLTDGRTWYPIYSLPLPGIAAFELANGMEKQRTEHNERAIARARREKSGLVVEHAGFSDLFAPIVEDKSVRAVIVAGPFATVRPTSNDMITRWRWLTGTQARASDPEFAHYLASTLAIATFEGSTLGVFRRFVKGNCDLLAQRGPVERLSRGLSVLRARLVDTRFAERSWVAAAEMIDERTSRAWVGSANVGELGFLGLHRAPEHVIVGLLSGREAEPDPVDDLLRRDAFQRACVEFARKMTRMVCARVGEHGVALLVDDALHGTRLRAKLVDIASRANLLARRFGFKLHAGISAPDDAAPLPVRYQSALSAAENALSEGSTVVLGKPGRARALGQLGEARRQLLSALGETPGVLAQRFDRYLEVVAVHAGYRLEPTRAHVEAAFDQLMDALRTAGAIDERSLGDLRRTLERAADTGTVRDLLVTYRRAIADVEQAIVRPKEARQERSLRRATAFIRDHLGEPLKLSRVARVAGFAPGYFSRLFSRSERSTFRDYVQRQRVERAKLLLESTTLKVERVGQLVGFGTRTRFHLAFRAALGTTPAAYRSKNRPARSA
jgi:AraC-like DNA-binding protein